jgi:uncharacterized protein (DUF433 family)
VKMNNAIDWTGCSEVERIPGKHSGAPILKDTRWPGDAVRGNYQDGYSVEEVADTFDLPVEQVRAVIEFATTRQSSGTTRQSA